VAAGIVIPQVLFTAGVSWFLAALGVFVRDLGQVMGFVLTIWFFVTPICYPETSCRRLAGLLSKNPIYVTGAALSRDSSGEPRAGVGRALELWAGGGGGVRLGHAWFYKLRKSFADMI